MKHWLEQFGRKMAGETLALTACAALLVLCALAISPSGKTELNRTLAFTQGGGTQTAFCIIHCSASVVVWRFDANPSQINQYDRTTLQWNSVGADYCWVQGPNMGKIVPSNGAITSTPLEVGTHTFYIKCYNTGRASSGESPWVAASVNVSTPPPPPPASSVSMTLTATPASITAGGSSILSWNATGDSSRIDACLLSGGRWGSGTETGSLTGALESGALTQTTVFAFTCHDTHFGWLSPVEAVVYVSPLPLAQCTSAPNACGMRSTGQIIDGVCNAMPPPNSQCPPPQIPTSGFFAEPSIVHNQQVAQISWNVTGATTCSLSSDSSSFPSREVELSGSVSSGAITQTTTFTLSCQNGESGPTASRSIRVIFDPTFREI